MAAHVLPTDLVDCESFTDRHGYCGNANGFLLRHWRIVVDNDISLVANHHYVRQATEQSDEAPNPQMLVEMTPQEEYELALKQQQQRREEQERTTRAWQIPQSVFVPTLPMIFSKSRKFLRPRLLTFSVFGNWLRRRQGV